MFACITLVLLPGIAAAEALLARRPALTLLLLSAVLFTLAAVLQRVMRPVPSVEAASSSAVLSKTEETWA